MDDLSNVTRVAVWTSVISTAAVLVALAFIAPMPLPAVIASLALVSVGAAVVGALVALSFSEQDH